MLFRRYSEHAGGCPFTTDAMEAFGRDARDQIGGASRIGTLVGLYCSWADWAEELSLYLARRTPVRSESFKGT